MSYFIDAFRTFTRSINQQQSVNTYHCIIIDTTPIDYVTIQANAFLLHNISVAYIPFILDKYNCEINPLKSIMFRTFTVILKPLLF